MNKENELIFENYTTSLKEEFGEQPAEQAEEQSEKLTIDELLGTEVRLANSDDELTVKDALELLSKEDKDQVIAILNGEETDTEAETEAEAEVDSDEPAFLASKEEKEDHEEDESAEDESKEEEKKKEYSEEEMEEANSIVSQMRDIKMRSGAQKVEEQLNVIKATQPALFEKISYALTSQITE